MRLECLPCSISIKPPPFIESYKLMTINLLRNPQRSPVKQDIRQRFVIEQDSFIISKSLSDDTTDSSCFIAEIFAPADQRHALVG